MIREVMHDLFLFTGIIGVIVAVALRDFPMLIICTLGILVSLLIPVNR